MSEVKPRFYFDENMPDAAAVQLRMRGIDALTAQQVPLRKVPDPVQLAYAIENKRVLCTYDKGFVDLAKTGIEHYGIAYFRGRLGDIGRIVRALTSIHEQETRESMLYRVEYL